MSTTEEAVKNFFISPEVGGVLIILVSPLFLFLAVKLYGMIGHSTYIKQVNTGSVRFFVRTRESWGYQLSKVIFFLMALALWPIVTVYGILVILASTYAIWDVDIFKLVPFDNPSG